MTEPQKMPSDLVMGLQNFESLWFNQFAVIAGQTINYIVESRLGHAYIPGPIHGWHTGNHCRLERSEW